MLAINPGGMTTKVAVYEGEGHSGPMRVGVGDFTGWLAARFAGEPADDTCAAARAAARPR